jgi:beta-galactosidase
MEDLDQAYGLLLYRTFSTDSGDFDLAIDGLHDYARIYINEKFVGTLDRRLDHGQLSVHIPGARSRLDILVENTGRVNYSDQIRDERKGITSRATLDGRQITDWQIYSLPISDPSREHFQPAAPCTGPCFYRGTFNVDQPGDSFLDTSQLGKGQLWVNGHALGRFWKIGPQKTLYLPAPWLKDGKNELIVFDVDAAPFRSVEGLTRPNLGN